MIIEGSSRRLPVSLSWCLFAARRRIQDGPCSMPRLLDARMTVIREGVHLLFSKLSRVGALFAAGLRIQEAEPRVQRCLAGS